MKVAVITPTRYLHVLEGLRLSYHMALGQHLVREGNYSYWYERAHSRGEFIIVDNGAAEPIDEREPFKNIVAAAEFIGADEIVMPDLLFDRKGTLELLRSTDPNLVPPRKRVVIPQGRSPDEWIECLTEIMKMQYPFRTLGIPKHLERWPAGRMIALSAVETMGLHLTHDVHLFGIWKNPREEAQTWKQFPWVRGIDSGAPFAYAQADKGLDHPDRESLSWSGKVNTRHAEHNVRMLERWARE